MLRHDPVGTAAIWVLVAISGVNTITYSIRAKWEFDKWRRERRRDRV